MSKSQGSICLSDPEYGRRAKCRGVGMQHAVPSRGVVVAYQGMTVPLPVSSLCGLPSSSRGSTGKEKLVTKDLSTSEERQKDSGFQSQFTSEMSCNGSLASSPVYTERDVNMMERGELIHSSHQQVAHRGEDLQERKAVNNLMPSVVEPPAESLHTSVALADAASLPVAAEYDSMDTPPPLVSAEPLLSAELEDSETNLNPGEPSAALQGSNKAGSTVTGNQAEAEEPSCSVSSATAAEGWSQAGRGRTLMHILSSGSRPVGKSCSNRSIPEGQDVPAAGSGLNVKETEAVSSNTCKQPTAVGSGQGEAVSAAQKTPKSSRKTKVSLAIKFQGALTSQHGAPESYSGIQSSAPTDQMYLKTSSHMLMKPSEFRLPNTEYAHLQSKTPEPVNAQERSPGLAHTERLSVESRPVPACKSGVEEGALDNQALSSDGDELDFVETRGGRNANELEKSIAGHQRSIHRNQTELKRMQKRNRAMEEELAGDLAEQCCGELEEDDGLEEATPEKLFCLDQLIGLQGQLIAQSEEGKRRAIENELLLEQGKKEYEEDKLASMEWKLEIEASELEDKLLLSRLETRVLQAKTELYL